MGSDVSLSKAVRSNLLSLQNTASMMDKTQSRLATGNKVNSALDNPSNFFTASALNSRAADMSNLLDSMASGIKVIEAASNGITAITKNVESMQSTLRQARQDKSFQTATFDVTKDSVLNVSGGQFGSQTEIKLGTQTVGTAAGVTGSDAYAGPVVNAVAAGANLEGAGARTVLDLDSVTDLAGKTIKVDGKTVTFESTDNTVAAATNRLNTVLGTTDYTITAGAAGADANKIVIENKKTTGYLSTSPVVDLGTSAATKASTSFVYDSTKLGASLTVDGTNVTVGGTATDFAANLQTTLGTGYSVALDTTNNTISVTNNAAGAGSVSLSGSGFSATPSVSKFNLSTTALQSVTVGGATVALAAGDNQAAVIGKFRADATFAANYSIEADGTGYKISSLATGAAATNPAVTSTVPAQLTNLAQSAGADAAVAMTQVPGTDGVTQTATAAASDDISIVYGDKTANIKVTGGNADDIKKSINDQLKTAGLDNLQATFSADGELSISSKSPEAKALTITGPQADYIFGAATAKTSTGTDSVSGYNSKNTVDMFVEEINRSQAGKLRASNDNGKLRIENLSTQELDVSHDADGAGVLNPVSAKISGNSVRANLSKQFNELRDQLDKLADDSSFNGINLLRGDKLKITFNESGSSSIDIQAKDANGNVRGINAANMSISSLMAEDLDTDEGIDSLLSTLSSALTELRSQASTFGSNLSSVENRQSFTKNMINTLETGASNLTLADTNEEAANLLALQTRQQLSSSALSMASQQDQAVLQLLR